jgi:ATP-dependent HslUV protease subunit HslV
VRKGDKVVMIGDGQVSLGASIVKPNARKVRRIGDGKVMVGFAGATADAFTLLERLEAKVEEYPGQLLRAGVETAKLWRTDKYLKHLEAMLIAADEHVSLCLTGNGDVIEPHDGLLGIGSGGSYALAAARALIDLPDQDAEKIARKAMKIAADTCVYTNHNWVVDSMTISPEAQDAAADAGARGDVLSTSTSPSKNAAESSSSGDESAPETKKKQE